MNASLQSTFGETVDGGIAVDTCYAVIGDRQPAECQLVVEVVEAEVAVDDDAVVVVAAAAVVVGGFDAAAAVGSAG
jgi:hypothetical protein